MSTPADPSQPDRSVVVNQVHELLADVRAASTALADPDTPFGGVFEMGSRAFTRGPTAAVFITAQIAARRLDQANRIRRHAGALELLFPRERFETCLRLRPAGRRRDARRDALAYLEHFVTELLPDPAPLESLTSQHGYPAFAAMLQLANETALILVEEDPALGDRANLFRLEALADETDWHNDPGSTA